MRLYYDETTGELLYTLNFQRESEYPAATNWIDVEDPPRHFEGYRVVEGVLSMIDISPERKAAISEINMSMSTIREQYVTNITGQEMLYQVKEEEARAYLVSDPEPTDLTDYPLIAAEVGITAPTAYEVAQVYLNMAIQWKTLAAQLETLRLGTIKSIEEALDTASISVAKQTYYATIASM